MENILNKIVDGDSTPLENNSIEISEFLQASKRIKDKDNTLDQLTYAYFMRFYKTQDEKKSSSPSHVHYGHLKALAWDVGLPHVKFRTTYLAYKREVVFKRWEVVWEVLFRKDKGTTCIHRF